jgi:polysaccharide pyruvyl transferase WcaK-like protein
VRLFIGHNFFGAGNLGDDLMLAGFLTMLRATAPEAQVTVCTPHDIASQRHRFPDVRWVADDESDREAAAREADLWLGLGDTPFQLDSGPWMLDHLARECERCERLGLPMAFLGVGCESRAAIDDPRARAVVAQAERIWTRDALSAELLAAAAPRDVVVLGADLAHVTLGAATAPRRETGVVGLLFAFEHPETVVLRGVEDFLARRAAGATRWLVQESRTFPFTERYLHAALSSPARAALRLMPLDSGTDELATFLGAFGAPEVVVSSRYHGALIAAWHGARVALVARSAKIVGAAADLDVPERDRIETAADLEALTAQARTVSAARLRVLRERAEAMCSEFVGWAHSLPRGRAGGSRTSGGPAQRGPTAVSETLEAQSPPRSGAALWDERELQHIREAIFRAPLRAAPSEHLYVESFFSPTVYAEMMRQFPTDREVFRRWRNPGDSALRFANYSQRQEISIPDEADRLPPEQRAFWLGMTDLICGPDFARVLFERFDAYVRRRFGPEADDPSFIEERVRGTMILNEHDADYYLGPHTDRGEKLFTCVFYFPEHEGLEHLGTTLYEPLEPGFTCPGVAHHDPARFRRGETMPYRANSALVFARTDVMFHGVHALTVDELQGSRRRGIQMQFYVRNERRREECKVTVIAPLPTMMRAGSADSIAYRLTNRAQTELASSFPYTTQLGYRWFTEGGVPVDSGAGGTELPGAFAPGQTRAGFIRVVVPSVPGRYVLRLSVVQSNVAWFDDIDPENGVAGQVTVWDPESAERAAEVALLSAGVVRPASRSDIVPDRDDIALGEGWYPAELAGGEAFRWVENDAVVHVAALRPVEHALALIVEPGPGVGGRPFELSVRLTDGRELGRVRIASKQPVAFALPPESPRIFSVVLHAVGGGAASPNDPRVLNFRVFDVAVERLADVFPAWATPGQGFYPLERHAGDTFRWVGGDASIAIHPAHGHALTFDVESGPGFASQSFTLQVEGTDGSPIATFEVGSRATVTVPLDGLSAGAGLLLRADGGGRRVDGDPRVLNYRIFPAP